MTEIKTSRKISHKLSISINPELTDAEKQEAALFIRDQINNKSIEKTMFDIPVSLTWRIADETDLLHYYTSDGGRLGDAVVKEHAKLVLSDVGLSFKPLYCAQHNKFANGGSNVNDGPNCIKDFTVFVLGS